MRDGRELVRDASSMSASSATRLAAVWSGLPSCSVIVFRHLQKTGGSSIVHLFESLERDLQWSVSGYWSHCYGSRKSTMAQARLRWIRALHKLAGPNVNRSKERINLPPWEARQLVHMHHPDSTYCNGLAALQSELSHLRPVAASLSCHVVVAMVVREPWSFFQSWYYYAGAPKCGHCAFSAFLRLNPNAQSHLAMGRYARQYDSALLARHASRDPELTAELGNVLAGVDLLGVTDQLDAFAFLLCERAGIRVCPRNAIVNKRNTDSAKRVERAVLYAQQQAQAQSQTQATTGGASGDDANAAMQQPLPNASNAAHRRQVYNIAGWLDSWMYRRAQAAFDAALGAGGPAMEAERRRRLEAWKALPPDASSGCLSFAKASAAEAAASITKAIQQQQQQQQPPQPPPRQPRIGTLLHGSGGGREDVGLRFVEEGADSAKRCERIRREAAQLAKDDRRWSEAIPASMRPVLLDPWPVLGHGGNSTPFAAICSTKAKTSFPNSHRRC